MCVLFASSIVFHKVTVFTNAAYKDREVTYRYMASKVVTILKVSVKVLV